MDSVTPALLERSLIRRLMQALSNRAANQYDVHRALKPNHPRVGCNERRLTYFNRSAN
jgi:hypothetical protein